MYLRLHNEGTRLFTEFKWKADCCRRLLDSCAAAALAIPLVGAAATPQLVRDINVAGHSVPNEFVEFEGKLVFIAEDATSGTELWISDGTAGGTTLLADINPGPSGSNPNHLIVANGALYFRANDGTGARLMRLSNPSTQVHILAEVGGQTNNINRPCQQSLPVAFGGAVYFLASFPLDPLQRLRLLRSDGTAAGTAPVDGTFSEALVPCDLTVHGGRLYFSAGNSTAGTELWTSDGTSTDTVQVADLWPGPGSGRPRGFIEFNGLLYFTARRQFGLEHLEHLWRTDGTAAGTFQVAEVGGQPSSNVRTRGVLNGRLLLEVARFEGSSSILFPRELWTSGGESTNTSLFMDFQSTGSQLLVAGTLAYFGAAASSAGNEPWVTDGTAAGTRLLKDLNPNGDSNPSWFADFRGVILMATSNATQGSQLWRTDGTNAGTVLISDIPPPPILRGPGEVRPFVTRQRLTVGQMFFFAAIGDDVGEELYVLRNEAPTVGADTASSVTAATTIRVLDNDTDPDGTLVPQSVRVAVQPTHGTVMTNADGTLVYTPASGFSGTDTFSYTVNDNQGAISNTATVTINPQAPAPAAPRRRGGGSTRAIELLTLCALLALRQLTRRFRLVTR